MYTHTHTHTHTHACTQTHTYTHTVNSLTFPTQTHTHKHTHAHTCMHTRTCTHSHTHTHTHTHIINSLTFPVPVSSHSVWLLPAFQYHAAVGAVPLRFLTGSAFPESAVMPSVLSLPVLSSLSPCPLPEPETAEASVRTLCWPLPTSCDNVII